MLLDDDAAGRDVDGASGARGGGLGGRDPEREFEELPPERLPLPDITPLQFFKQYTVSRSRL